MRFKTLLLFLSMLLIQPLSAQAIEQSSVPTKNEMPIFMFHEIGQGANSLYVPEQNFEALIAHLSKEGYKSVTLSQFLDNKITPNQKYVVLTFDDGYASFYDKAYPILKKYHYTATVFIISDMVNKPNHMTWTQLRNLANQGIEVGSHSETHPYLSKLTDSSLQDEVEGSKQKLEAMLNKKITDFCYPYGDFNEDVIELVKKTGYKAAVTVNTGISSVKDNPYQLPRINVYGCISSDSLDSILKMTPDQFNANIANSFLAVDLDNNDANAYLNRGMAFDSLGNYTEAMNDYTKAIQIKPDFSEAYNGRGYVYNELGQFDKAIADYTKSCTLTPTFAYPYNNRGAAYIKAEEYTKAIQDFNKVIDIDPQFPYLSSTYNKRGYAYTKLHDYNKALMDYNQSLTLNGDYADAYNNRGYLYLLTGDYEKALNDIQKAIEIDNTQSTYYYNLSKVYAALGQSQLSRSMLQKSLELNLQ